MVKSTMVKSTSTRAIISRLQAFEARYGVGSVTSIGTVCSGNRTVEYIFHIKDDEGNDMSIEIPTMNEAEIFENNPKQEE